MMSKVAVVYWSGTSNTQAMAEAVAEGAKEKGAEVSVIEAAEFPTDQVNAYDGIAFGCPAMGDELFNMLSTLFITFLPSSKRLLISWLQSPSAVILEPLKIKSDTVSSVSPSICH